MIDSFTDSALMLLEAKGKLLVCEECGRNHAVKFSTDASRHLLFYDFPDHDTCDGFKRQVQAFINTEVNRDNSDLLSKFLGALR